MLIALLFEVFESDDGNAHAVHIHAVLFTLACDHFLNFRDHGS